MSASHPARDAARPLAARLASQVFRVNPQYRLVARRRLPAAERRRLGVDATGPEYAAVLIPAVGGLPVKVVCATTASLLRSLARPASLPGAVRRRFAADPSALPRLVLDSVLELHVRRRFVTGAAAGRALGLPPPECDASTRPGRLSVEALHYAQAANGASAAALADLLYQYNRAPVSPAWAARLATPDDVARYLGLDRGRPTGQLIAAEWRALTPGGDASGWLCWRGRDGDERATRHKLYVSIDLRDLGEAFPIVVGVATDEGVPAFKIAADLYGLHRPDKLVLYAETRARLERLGTRLAGALRGARAQGAPFSCALDADGLLSWGVDPPPAPGSDESPLSWRRWVAERLAAALCAARHAGSARLGVQPWQYALQRLQLDGVDTRRWTLSGRNDGMRGRARD